ncbi:MAG: NUDIX hydrolase [Lachnospiraceae bacterium]|jgi:ADP-ribose pyrophosphatase|nr:NUDIX hydrolase [Lachnospiraceae bacterium]
MIQDIKRIDRIHRYKGTVLDVYEDVMMIDGREAHWDFIHHNGAAAVVPVDADGKILMVRQYRNALERVTLEIPAGKLDTPDEPAIVCAARELEEETGQRSDDLEFLIRVHSTVAFCDEKIDIYVARNLVPTAQRLDADEAIDVERWDIEDLVQLAYDGQLTDSKTVAAVMAYHAKFPSEQ